MSARKRRVNRGTILVLLIAALILALLFVGHGMCGLGKGKGDGKGTGKQTSAPESTAPEATPQKAADLPDEPTADAAPRACQLRLASDGTISADGEPVELEAAVAHCAGAGQVVIEAAGDAPFGALQDLRAALEKAGLRVTTPGP